MTTTHKGVRCRGADDLEEMSSTRVSATGIARMPDAKRCCSLHDEKVPKSSSWSVLVGW